MKRIISSKLDDIVRQEEEYNAKVRPLQERYDRESKAWRAAYRGQQQDVANSVLAAIGPTSLELEARAEETWRDGYEVYIQANERRLHSDDSALSWHYKVVLDENGDLTFESGSWSGLKATTPEQLASLKESVRVLEILQGLDWKSLLTVDKDRYSFEKFVDKDNASALQEMQRSKPNFADLKKAAVIDDLMGTHKVVKVSGLPDDGYRNGIFNGYLQIISKSPSTYTVREISKWDIDNAQRDEQVLARLKRDLDSGWSIRKKAANVLRAVDTDEIIDIDSF